MIGTLPLDGSHVSFMPRPLLHPSKATRLPTDWVPQSVWKLRNKKKPAPVENRNPNTPLLSHTTLYTEISHKIYQVLKFRAELDTFAIELDHTIKLLKKRG